MANDITPALLEMARKHFQVYMAVVHMTDAPDIFDGHALAADHHKQMIDMLLSDEREILMICPRGASKTTLIAGWEEWRLGRASESGKHWQDRIRILYVTAAASQAYKVSNAMRATIEGNETFKAIFPKVKPHPNKWGEEEWKVKGNTIKDSNFQAVGIDGAALGSRADEIILDDVGDEKNMGTSYQRQVIRDRLDNTIMPILVPGGRVIMLCTRWAWDDAADWAENQQGFKPLLIKALREDDEGNKSSYWPERFPVKWLLNKQAKNPKSFARQYQNEVVPDEGLIFTRDWFEPRFDYLPSEVRWRLCSWDTAAGQGRNRSYSAGWSALVTPDFHVYLFRLTRGQVPYPYLREAIKHQANEDKANFVIIEKKSSGHQVIQEYALESHPWKVIEWQPFGQRGSPTRLEANEKISAMCQTGMVHLPSEYFMRKMGASWLPDAEKEIFSYPDGESDDIVDAMCQLLYWVQEQRHAWERRLRNINTEPGRWVTPRGQQWEKVRV